MSPETFSPADALSIPWGRLALVLALCSTLTFVLVFVLRRMHGLGTGRRRERQLTLMDTLPIGPRRAIYTIDALGRTLVIAAAGERVTLLLELTARSAPEPEEPIPDHEDGTTTSLETAPAFERVLKAVRHFGARREEKS
jgi:flagellar biogenesis protein FliO